MIDFGDLPVFSAAAYPAIFIAQKAPPNPDQAIVAADLNLPVRRRLRGDGQTVNVENVRAELDDLPALIKEARADTYPQGLLRREGWILDDPVLVRLFERLMNEGTPLGEYVKGRMYRGVVTGLNEAFVIDQATRDALIAADPRSAEVIKPWLRGRDIKRWQPAWAGLFVIFTRRGIDIDRYPAIREHLMEWRDELEPRRPGDRTSRKGRKPGSYKWYEVQDNVAYWSEFEQPKLIWADIAKTPQFAYDDAGHFCANTIYISPALSLVEAALLNSSIGAFLMSQISPAIQNGYRRYFSQYVETLPLPDAVSETIRLELRHICETRDETGLDELAFAAYRLDPEQQRALREFQERSLLVQDDSQDHPVQEVRGEEVSGGDESAA